MEYGSCHHGIIEIKKGAHETLGEMIRTLAHEITHETLSNQTTLGNVVMLLQLISSHPQTSKDNARQLEQIYKHLHGNCIKVHEFSAVCAELNITKMHYPETFDELVREYSNTQPYKNACDFRNRKWLFDYPFEFISSLILDIAKISMNIQLSKLDILDKKLDKMLINQRLVDVINPNYRFKILLGILKDVLHTYGITQKTKFDSVDAEDKCIKSIIDSILQRAGTSYSNSEIFDLEVWYNTTLKDKFRLLEFNEYCERYKINDIVDLARVIDCTTFFI